MFEIDEKVIFKINSGYCLNGVMDNEIKGDFLMLTNLGNIYVSKVDYLDEEIMEYYKYDYSRHKKNLYCEIDGDSINILSEELPFTKYTEHGEATVFLSLITILDLHEFDNICRSIDDVIFTLKKGYSIMTLDNGHIMAGTIEKGIDRIIFSAGSNRYEFILSDVESYRLYKNKLILHGYFYNDIDSQVIRYARIISDFDNHILPKKFENIVKNNKKIGRIPEEDGIVFCRVSGSVNGREYLLKNMFLIKHQNLYILYEKKSKDEILCESISNIRAMYLGAENHIVYDGNNVFNLYLDDKSCEEIGFKSVSELKENKIGFTKEHRPLFMKITDEDIVFLKSEHREILRINKSSVSDIKMYEESIPGEESYVETEIKFTDKSVTVNLRREVVTELISDIFADYQKSLVSGMAIEEVYENWVKSVSDMVLFNFFSNIYDLHNCIPKTDISCLPIEEKVDFINDLYEKLQQCLTELDNAATSTTSILENIEEQFFRYRKGYVDLGAMDKLNYMFLELRRNIKMDFMEITKTVESISFAILPIHMRRSFSRLMKEQQSYQVDFFANQAYNKLVNLIYTMLPHYISNTIEKIFDVYRELYENYVGMDDDMLKEELLDRIKSTHIFKQFSLDSDNNVLRKDAIDDLYSLVKFTRMRIDSDFYYTGGFR